MTNLDRSQDEATFQQEQQDVARLAEQEQADNQESVNDDPVDYYGEDDYADATLLRAGNETVVVVSMKRHGLRPLIV